MTPEELEKHNKKILRMKMLDEAEAISYEECYKIFEKWMIMSDRGILKLLLAYYCAKFIPGKALWLIIIGPSGGGKTEFLNAFMLLPFMHSLSTLTPNTFLSGMPGKNDSSLLPKINNKILVMKDLTSLLSMQKDAKAEIMGQLREIYDGSATKSFGNGKTAKWDGKVSVLAASTQAVDLNQQQYTYLGERFLDYRLIMPDRKIVARRSLNNESHQNQMEEELQNAVFLFMKGIELNREKYPELAEEYKDKLVNLSNFSTLARSGIIRDTGFKKEVIFVPAAEMPTRITGQLAKIGAGLMMVNGGDLTKEDVKIIYKTALDSIPQTNKMVIIEMAKADGQSTAEIATALGYPTEPIRMYLDNLAMLRVCHRTKEGSKYCWTMNPEFSEIIREYEHVIPLTEEQIALRQVVTEEEQSPEDRLNKEF